MVRSLPCLLLACALVPRLAAQDPPAPSVQRIEVAGAEPIEVAQQLPAGFDNTQWRPLVVLLGVGEIAAAKTEVTRYAALLGGDGCVVVAPALAAADARWGRCLQALRRRFRIANGGMDGIGVLDRDGVRALVATHRHQFGSFFEIGGDRTRRIHMPRRRVANVAPDHLSSLSQMVQLVHDRPALMGAAKDISQTLDEFHDAAANGDEARYFAILPDDAVFLGTDATERWTGKQFRDFAMPYFQRDEAWTYVPIARNVTVAPGGNFAWFDEALDNASYGECRGTGVLARRGDVWVLQQYDLTIPVPNDLADGICKRIRAFGDGKAPAVTTIVAVRHAEKVDASTDAALSEAGRARAEALAKALRDLPIAAAYATEFQRTQGTIAPLCAQRSLQLTVLPATDGKALARTLQRAHLGQTVLVCGHSNTVPALCKALGVPGEVAIADDEFDRLFVITLGPDGASVLPLRY